MFKSLEIALFMFLTVFFFFNLTSTKIACNFKKGVILFKVFFFFKQSRDGKSKFLIKQKRNSENNFIDGRILRV